MYSFHVSGGKMAKSNKKKLIDLSKQGEQFTYKNFAVFQGGSPKAHSPEYVQWILNVELILANIFGKESPIYYTFLQGKAVRTISMSEIMFSRQKNYITGALQTAIDNVKEKPQIESGKKKLSTTTKSKKIFIVHGHDEKLRNELEKFLFSLKLEPVILHQEADEGQTIIEKFEKNSDVGYAFILLTPDDKAYPASDDKKMARDNSKDEYRARQNVIFEFGYFAAKLGRSRVCCIYKKGVSLPTDVTGIVYKKVDENLNEIIIPIVKDLKAAGYDVGL